MRRFRVGSAISQGCALATVLLASALACDADFGPDHTIRSATLPFEGSVLSLAEVRELTPLFLNAARDVVENVSDVSWRSSDPALVTVDLDGNIRGVALGGPVTITVSGQGHSASTTIIVVPERVQFSESVSSLIIGRTVRLAGTAVDYNGVPISASSAPVRWSSGDPTIATADEQTGLVTAIAPGEVFIYATAAGRTSGLNIETGDPSVYDGNWSGESACPDCTIQTAYPVAFEVFFGRVKSFHMTVTGPPPFTQCGAGDPPILLIPPATSPNAVIRDDQFTFRLPVDIATVSGTFLSRTSMTGMHTGMSIPVSCPRNILPVAPLNIAAAGFSATRQ